MAGKETIDFVTIGFMKQSRAVPTYGGLVCKGERSEDHNTLAL